MTIARLAATLVDQRAGRNLANPITTEYPLWQKLMASPRQTRGDGVRPRSPGLITATGRWLPRHRLDRQGVTDDVR